MPDGKNQPEHTASESTGRSAAAAVLVNTLSPERSLSEITLVTNTLSPAQSLTPEAIFGRARVNTLSPAASVSPISVELGDDRTLDVSANALTPVGALNGISGFGDADVFNSTVFDTFLVAQLLYPGELLKLEARKLLVLKHRVLHAIVSSPEIRDQLRVTVEAALEDLGKEPA